VVHVDQEAAGGEADREREALGARVDGRAGDGGGDEMTSGADGELLAQVRVAEAADANGDRLTGWRQPSERDAIDQVQEAAPESFQHAS
jgi:hypothetical protein